ncbi:MAG: spore germination protein [Peptococcaceae bacterium]|nr:spore germination protein [Peptococcaceae bacterium]
MFWWQSLADFLLFKEPQEPPTEFVAGAEDRQQQRQERTEKQDQKAGRDEVQPDEVRPAAQKAARDAETRETVFEMEASLSNDLDQNKKVLENVFRTDINDDPIIRVFTIGTDNPVRAMLVFYDGLSNKTIQNFAILQPLMLLSGLREDDPKRKNQTDQKTNKKQAEKSPKGNSEYFDRVKDALLPGNQVQTVTTYKEVAAAVLSGDSVLLVDGSDRALSIETKAWPNRGVQRPEVESVVRGPQEAFTEQIRINIALVRKIIRKASLITEFIKVGDMTETQCAIMYLDDVVNPAIVSEVKRRLKSIKADYVQESGLLENFIEDKHYGMAPQVLATERPDRVAANIMEGQVAIFVNGNPYVMIVPMTFFGLIQSSEDAYVRWPFGSLLRLVRWFGLGLALFLPALYIAVTTYHQEFIPTDLLLAMTGAREKVPFPTIIEVLLMEVSFELIREAGIRMPGVVGTTLGIIGALILGQAAVAANIVSPILIVIVAVTAIGGFTVPAYGLGLSVRMQRFIYILLAAVMGLFGIVVGIFLHVAFLVNLRSFGVPYMAPVAPTTGSSPDYFLRGPVWRQERRPDYLDPLRGRRQPRISRGWWRMRRKGGGGS